MLPQEIAMETRLRNRLTEELQKLATQKKWQLYLLNESDYDRPNAFISYSEWEATPYEKRPPHIYAISFIFITNKDSLKACQNWNNEFIEKNRQIDNNMSAGLNSKDNDKNLQAYMYSSLYYTHLLSKYIQEHEAQHLKDIQLKNEKAIKAFEDKENEYQEKSDAFGKKYQAASTMKYAASETSFDQLSEENIKKTETFINASVLLVHFAFNSTKTGFGFSDGSQKYILPQRKIAVPNAFYAGMLRNPDAPLEQSYRIDAHNFLYSSPSTVATILFGGWLNKHDAYNSMRAAFASNSANTNLTSIKKIKCDVVQNIILQIEGRPDYIQAFLNGVDVNALEKLTAQKGNN